MNSHNTINHHFKFAYPSAPATFAKIASAHLASNHHQSASKTLTPAHSVDDSDNSSTYED
jgi:hypothetical protein